MAGFDSVPGDGEGVRGCVEGGDNDALVGRKGLEPLRDLGGEFAHSDRYMYGMWLRLGEVR